MDLTHETYVHRSSLGQKEIDETPLTTKIEGHEVVSRRYMDGVMAPPFWAANLRAHGLPDDQPVDRWQVCRFSPPSHVMIEVGVALAGKGGYVAAPQDKVSSVVVDFITPESDNTMWYFWGMARNFRAQDTELTAQIREGQGKVFSEDTAILELQQKSLEAWPGRKLLMLNIDAGGVQARRMIDKMIAAEAASVPAELASAA
jgi:vanillate O-demethylase monooxygenase subunit